MKTLNTYITEWKASNNTVSSIEKHDINKYFVYKQDIKGLMKIVDRDWMEFLNYKDKIYIDGKKVELNNDNGYTKEEYDVGYHFVEIKDIDDVKDCTYMFWYCTKLIKVPKFDTSIVQKTFKMFYGCSELKDVPLFDMSNVKSINDSRQMFYDCRNLSEKTKQEWSQIYDFQKEHKK